MLTVEDKFAIQELIHRFAHYSDYENYTELSTLFTPEVVTHTIGTDVKFAGIDAQIAHARESASFTAGKNRHFNMNLLIEEEGGQVFAHYFVLNVNGGSRPMALQMVVSGRMRDHVVKTAAGWRIAERTFAPDQSFEYIDQAVQR
jgi:SnoaL-like protein